jgi:hypothetical protein
VIKLVLWRRKGSLRSPTFQGKQAGRRLQHGGKCGSWVRRVGYHLTCRPARWVAALAWCAAAAPRGRRQGALVQRQGKMRLYGSTAAGKIGSMDWFVNWRYGITDYGRASTSLLHTSVQLGFVRQFFPDLIRKIKSKRDSRAPKLGAWALIPVASRWQVQIDAASHTLMPPRTMILCSISSGEPWAGRL